MKCKNVKKILLLFLDEELTQHRQSVIKKHLKLCNGCRKELEKLSDIYSVTDKSEKIIPSPFLWTRISAAITENKKRQGRFTRIRLFFPQFAASLGMVMLFCMGIGIGIFLGSFPVKQNNNIESVQKLSSREEFIISAGLDKFNNLPPGSIGSVYLELTSDNQ